MYQLDNVISVGAEEVCPLRYFREKGVLEA
jgi:hypothetical protein